MRVNKYVASASQLSRRGADDAIRTGRVTINGRPATQGSDVVTGDEVQLDDKVITPAVNTITVMYHKPAGLVVSRDGQGSQTIYDTLPPELQQLQPVGRLDKFSSGLLLLTNDGALANELTHPRYQKTKVYEATLTEPLQPLHQQMISDIGVTLDDGPSKLDLQKIDDSGRRLRVTMHEGRNRQIRRTFSALGYHVHGLHRTRFGNYTLGDLPSGATSPISI